MAPADEPVDGLSASAGAPDTFEFERLDRHPPKRRRGLKIFVLFLVFAGAGGGGWWLYGAKPFGLGNGGIPIIRADSGPFKFKPENPGGLVVPDRDKLVYDRLPPGPPAPPPERLLPEPEAPLPAPVKAVATGETPPGPDPEKPKDSRPTPERVIAATPPPPPPPPPLPNAAARRALLEKSFKIQLAAVRSETRAGEEWERLRDRHPDLLGGLRLLVTRADLGAKGIFFRLRAGPLADRAQAAGLCAKLAAQKVGCLVVSPGN